MNGGFSRKWFNISMGFKEEMLKLEVEKKVKNRGGKRIEGVEL